MQSCSWEKVLTAGHEIIDSVNKTYCVKHLKPYAPVTALPDRQTDNLFPLSLFTNVVLVTKNVVESFSLCFVADDR